MNKLKAFTLVELLVVVAIISVLAGMMALAIMKGRKAAYVADTRNTIQQISSAAQIYYTDFGDYPPQYPTGATANTGAAIDAYILGVYLAGGGSGACPDGKLWDGNRKESRPAPFCLPTASAWYSEGTNFYLKDPWWSSGANNIYHIRTSRDKAYNSSSTYNSCIHDNSIPTGLDLYIWSNGPLGDPDKKAVADGRITSWKE